MGMMSFVSKKKIIVITIVFACFALLRNFYEIKILQEPNDLDVQEQNFIFFQLQINLRKSDIHLRIINKNKSLALEAKIGENIKYPAKAKINKNGNHSISIVFSSSLNLQINFKEITDHDNNRVECYNLVWKKLSQDGENNFSHRDRIRISDSYWYGGALMHESYWPMNNKSHSMAPFVTGNSYHNDYGSIQERFWLSSTGSSIFVEYDVPLFVDINHSKQGWMTFEAKDSKPYRLPSSHPLILNYTLCTSQSNNPREMFKVAANKFWKKPTNIPNKELFKYPTWSTWAAFKRSISSKVLTKFASDIATNGFRSSQLIIDDGWMTHYGDFEFNSKLIPDPVNLIRELKQILNTTVSLWVHPFSSFLSSAFWKRDSNGKSIWMRSYFDWWPSQIIWWNGLGSLLDLTNHEAFQWYLEELHKVQQIYDIDAFKFDAGESTWLPSKCTMENQFLNPNDYTRLFSEIVFRSDFKGERLQEVRSLVSSQHLPFFVRLIDKNSDWSNDNGILSIIPQTLTMGVIGYPFVFPDMIGGNGYFGIFIHFSILPERELYIRWLQLSALMPTMQFSIPPWSFDDEVIQIARNMTKLHESYSNLIISLAMQALQTGEPIIRPLWWSHSGVNGDDKELFTCETEFMLGNDILVAPILEKGARKRRVYMPQGRWLTGGEGQIKVYQGDTWHEIDVALNELAYFVRST